MTAQHEPWANMGEYARLGKELPGPFPAPTFPEPGMFLQRLDGLDPMERWYGCLVENLIAFVKDGRPFFDPQNVVRFPGTMPFAEFLRSSQVGELDQRHRDLCNQTRQVAFQRQVGSLGEMAHVAQQALASARALIQSIRRLREGGAEIPRARLSARDLPAIADRFIQGHQKWVTRYDRFLNDLLDSGVLRWDALENSGDFFNCPLGVEMRRKTGLLAGKTHLPAIHALEMAHKDFHAAVAVEAEIAAALRGRGLTPAELDRVRELMDRRKSDIQQRSRELMTLIPAALQAAIADQGPSRASDRMQALPQTTLSQVIAEVQAWEQRILDFIDKPFDPTIDRVLLHTGCPTGRRIHAAMADPIRLKTYTFTLQSIDAVHLRSHSTGNVITAFVREGLPDEARMLVPSLRRDIEHMVEFFRRTGDIIGIAPG